MIGSPYVTRGICFGNEIKTPIKGSSPRPEMKQKLTKKLDFYRKTIPFFRNISISMNLPSAYIYRK